MVNGFDASNVNGDTTYAAMLPGAGFVIHKATEGGTFVDQKYPARIAAARAAHKLTGSYHFGRPSQPAAQQVAAYLAAAKPQPGEMLVHDLEVTDSLADHHVAMSAPFDRHTHRATFPARAAMVTPAHWATIANDACLFADTIKAAVGVDNLFYSFPAFITPLLANASSAARARLLAMPLWIADPNHPAGHPILPGGWPTWLLHQYGIVGGLDADTLNGDAATWLAHAVPTPEDDMAQEALLADPNGPGKFYVLGGNITHITSTATLGKLEARLKYLDVPAELAVELLAGKGLVGMAAPKGDAHE